MVGRFFFFSSFLCAFIDYLYLCSRNEIFDLLRMNGLQIICINTGFTPIHSCFILWMARRLHALTPDGRAFWSNRGCEWFTDYMHLHHKSTCRTKCLCCEWLTDYYHLHLARWYQADPSGCEWLTDYMNSSVLRNPEKGGSCEWLTDYMHQHLDETSPHLHISCEWLTDYMHQHRWQSVWTVWQGCELLADYYHLHPSSASISTRRGCE